MALFTLTGCGNASQQAVQVQDALFDTSSVDTTPDTTPGQGGTHQISSQRAREIAVQFVGYGTVHDVLAFTEEGILTFEVDVRHGAMRYVVLINAESGNVARLSRYEDETAVATAITQPAHPQPTASPPGVQGNRPLSPAISLDRAIEIAYADLASRGINATYRSNSGIDWERGQWVWELLFRTRGEGMPFIEFYINVDNGNIVKFEWDD